MITMELIVQVQWRETSYSTNELFLHCITTDSFLNPVEMEQYLHFDSRLRLLKELNRTRGNPIIKITECGLSIDEGVITIFPDNYEIIDKESDEAIEFIGFIGDMADIKEDVYHDFDYEPKPPTPMKYGLLIK